MSRQPAGWWAGLAVLLVGFGYVVAVRTVGSAAFGLLAVWIAARLWPPFGARLRQIWRAVWGLP